MQMYSISCTRLLHQKHDNRKSQHVCTSNNSTSGAMTPKYGGRCRQASKAEDQRICGKMKYCAFFKLDFTELLSSLITTGGFCS